VDRLEAYRAGAWEFVSEPMDSEALLLRLENFIAAKRELDRCREDSLLDTSTGLYNVRGLARRAQEVGADAMRRRSPLACLAVAPASHGEHAISHAEMIDRITEHLGEVFRRTARISDIVGHLGRSEFAVIAPATDPTGVLRFIERLEDTLRELPLQLEGQSGPVEFRAGYAAVPDFGASSVDAVELLLRAATALRHAKSVEGGARVSAFEDVPVRFVH
jgi:diguanylate cyclase (GGDEF)-like protein